MNASHFLQQSSGRETENGREAMAPAAFETHAIAILKEEGMRITAPRIEVVRALAMSDRAMTVYGIHEAVLQRGRRIDVVSVYRIVATLRRLGLVAHIGMLDGYVPRRFVAQPGCYTAMLVDVESRRVREVDCGPELSRKLTGCVGSDRQIDEVRIEVAVSPETLD